MSRIICGRLWQAEGNRFHVDELVGDLPLPSRRWVRRESRQAAVI